MNGNKMNGFSATSSAPNPFPNNAVKWRRPNVDGRSDARPNNNTLGGPLPSKDRDAFSRHLPCVGFQPRRRKYEGADDAWDAPMLNFPSANSNNSANNRRERRAAEREAEQRREEARRVYPDDIPKIERAMALLWRDEEAIWTEERTRFCEGRRWRQWNGQEGGGKRRGRTNGPPAQVRVRLTNDEDISNHDEIGEGTRRRWRMTTRESTQDADDRMTIRGKIKTLEGQMRRRHEVGRNWNGNDYDNN